MLRNFFKLRNDDRELGKIDLNCSEKNITFFRKRFCPTKKHYEACGKNVERGSTLKKAEALWKRKKNVGALQRMWKKRRAHWRKKKVETRSRTWKNAERGSTACLGTRTVTMENSSGICIVFLPRCPERWSWRGSGNRNSGRHSPRGTRMIGEIFK